MKVPVFLVTGFEPFGGSALNPSALLLDKLLPPTGWELAKQVFPVDTLLLPDLLSELLESLRPSAILCLGEARGRSRFLIETLARNELTFSFPDNGGTCIKNGKVLNFGPPTLASTLCSSTMVESLSGQGLEAHLSDHAGGFLCNQLFYLCCAHTMAQGTPGGFLHLPSLPEQGFGLGIPLEDQVRGVQALLEALGRSLLQQKVLLVGDLSDGSEAPETSRPTILP